MAFGSPPTHATGYPPQLTIPPIIGATGGAEEAETDFEVANAGGAGLLMATDGADGVKGIGGGGGIFLSGVPVSDSVAGSFATVDPRGSENLGSVTVLVDPIGS